MKISLIIPCYNEELSLNPLYDELKKVSAQLSDYEFEYIFVDDGSSTDDRQQLLNLCAPTHAGGGRKHGAKA